MLGALDVFHVGLVVEDIHVAMDALGTGLSLSWAPVQARVQPLRTGGGQLREEPIRFTYSREGPPHVELIEPGPESVWELTAPGCLHHVGAFAQDVATSPGAGLELEFGGGHRETPSGFAYYLAPHGIRIELVQAARREQFATWLAGGELAPR